MVTHVAVELKHRGQHHLRILHEMYGHIIGVGVAGGSVGSYRDRGASGGALPPMTANAVQDKDPCLVQSWIS